MPDKSERPDRRELERWLEQCVDRYPQRLRATIRERIPRFLFQVEQAFRSGGKLADLGGGLGLFAPACARLGMEAWLVDDLQDPVYAEYPLRSIGVHEECGVHLLEIDVFDIDAHFEDDSLDVVTAFFTVEHWQRPPRPVLHVLRRILKPGGILFIGALNGLAWHERVATFLGMRAAAHFDEWYRSDRFRGIVRPLNHIDLRRIAADLGLEQVRVIGRNWPGHGPDAPVGSAVLDRCLRLAPGLCTSVYMAGRLPR